jgi:hypothetical protein
LFSVFIIGYRFAKQFKIKKNNPKQNGGIFLMKRVASRYDAVLFFPGDNCINDTLIGYRIGSAVNDPACIPTLTKMVALTSVPELFDNVSQSAFFPIFHEAVLVVISKESCPPSLSISILFFEIVRVSECRNLLKL